MAQEVTRIGDGRKVVAAAGVREALASPLGVISVTVMALATNTGVVVVGGETVVAAVATRRGLSLAAGDSVGLMIDNLADVYLDATVSGEGVSFTYLL